MIVYGVLSYSIGVALIIGYFIVKKYGDRRMARNELTEER